MSEPTRAQLIEASQGKSASQKGLNIDKIQAFLKKTGYYQGEVLNRTQYNELLKRYLREASPPVPAPVAASAAVRGLTQQMQGLETDIHLWRTYIVNQYTHMGVTPEPEAIQYLIQIIRLLRGSDDVRPRWLIADNLSIGATRFVGKNAGRPRVIRGLDVSLRSEAIPQVDLWTTYVLSEIIVLSAHGARDQRDGGKLGLILLKKIIADDLDLLSCLFRFPTLGLPTIDDETLAMMMSG